MMRVSILKIFKFVQQYKIFSIVMWAVLSATVQAMTLENAIESAVKLDPTLRASKFNLMATEENIAVARSRFLPQIALQGSSNQLTQTTTQDLNTGGSVSRSFSGPSVNHQFVIRQALLRPKDLSSLRYSELQLQYVQLKFKYDLSDLKNRVISAWIDLLGAQIIEEAFSKPLPYIKLAAKQERSKLEQGDSTKDLVMEADAQYLSAKATYVQAVETLKAKKSVFEKLTGIPAVNVRNNKFDLVPKPLILESEKSATWERVRETSLELQMSQLQEMMQIEKIKIAEADHKPTLDLLATVNMAKNDATSTQGYQYKNKQIGIQYLVPLYSGGSVSSAVRQATLASESSKFETEALNLKVQIEFENNWGQLISSGYRQNAMYVSLLSVDEQLKATNRQVELGVKTLSELVPLDLSYARRLNDLVNVAQDHLRIQFKLKLKI